MPLRARAGFFGPVLGLAALRRLSVCASTITGTSAVGAFGTMVIGAIFVLVILIGGRSIAAGEMTVGDLFSYIFFTGLMAAPVIQISARSRTLAGTRSEAAASVSTVHVVT